MLNVNTITKRLLLNSSKYLVTIAQGQKINIIRTAVKKCSTQFLLQSSTRNFSTIIVAKNIIATAITPATATVRQRSLPYPVPQPRYHPFIYLSQSARNMSAGKPKIVFVLGGPGAGKGTQCQKIVDNFGFTHLSAGDLLREERSREGSEYGELIEDCIKNGKIVPVEVTCSLLEIAMNKIMKESGKNKFLIDGFPRNQDNMDGWNRKMAEKVQLLFVLFFDCAEDTCIERCLNRGKSGSGRSDDNLESLKKRIQTYRNDSMPIIDFYKNLNLVQRIDASPNAEIVFQNVEKIFIDCKSLEGSGVGDQ